MVSAGIDFEKPRPLQVLVGVRTSVTTGFFNIAVRIQTYSEAHIHLHRDNDMIFLEMLIFLVHN